MANNIVRYLQVAVAEHEPQNPNILWLKPVEGGFAFYFNQNGVWNLLRLMNGHGTPNPEDDTPIDIHEGQLAPDTVGTEQIIDNSVIMDDLNDTVKEKIQKTYYEDEEELHMGFDIQQNNGLQEGYTEVEEEEGE